MRPHLILPTPVSHTSTPTESRSSHPRRVPRPELRLDGLVPAWILDLELLGRSVSTRRTYRAVLKTLLRGVNFPSDLTPESIRRIAQERLGAWKPQSVRTGMHVLQSFCAWLVREGHLPANPVVRVPRPALGVREHRILSQEQTSALWHATKSDAERLILVLLLNGLRAGELCSLRWSDLDVAHGVIRLCSTKGQRPRAIPIEPRTARLLASHRDFTIAALVDRNEALASRARQSIARRAASRQTALRAAIVAIIGSAGRPLLPKEINAALNETTFGARPHIRTLLHHMRVLGIVSRCREGFYLGDGESLVVRVPGGVNDDRIFQFTPQTLLKRIANLGLRAGIERVHPHLLRHTFASHFRLQGGDEASLMAIGGWSSSEMARYYGRSVLGAVAMQRSRELQLTERLIGTAPSTDTPVDLVERVLKDPILREQVLMRLVVQEAERRLQPTP